MAAEGNAPTAGEYIVHHLTHLNSSGEPQKKIIDFTLVNWDTVFWSVLMASLSAYLLLKAARAITPGAPGRFVGAIEFVDRPRGLMWSRHIEAVDPDGVAGRGGCDAKYPPIGRDHVRDAHVWTTVFWEAERRVLTIGGADHAPDQNPAFGHAGTQDQVAGGIGVERGDVLDLLGATDLEGGGGTTGGSSSLYTEARLAVG